MGFALAFFLHTEGQAPLLALLIFPPKTAAQICSTQPHLCVRWAPRTTRKFFFFGLHPALGATQQHHCHGTWFASFIRHNNQKMLEGRNSSSQEQFRGFSAGGTSFLRETAVEESQGSSCAWLWSKMARTHCRSAAGEQINCWWGSEISGLGVGVNKQHLPFL